MSRSSRSVRSSLQRPVLNELPAAPWARSSAARKIRCNKNPRPHADDLRCRYEALQPSPERPVHVRGSELEEAQGYRQPSTKTVQGPGCYAIGTSTHLLRTREISCEYWRILPALRIRKHLRLGTTALFMHLSLGPYSCRY